MRLKKVIFVFQILAILMSPKITYADLYVTNNTTTEWLSEKFINMKTKCSTSIKGGLTGPMQLTVMQASQISSYLCNDTAPCIAQIMVSNDFNSANTCNGHVIGKMEINDLTSDIIANIVIYDPNYIVTGIGTNHIYLMLATNNSNN
jgi:hypothetical protein